MGETTLKFPMDELVDAYINALPKGTKDKSIAHTFNHIQSFCHWKFLEYGYPPTIDVLTDDDRYREIRSKYLAAKPDFPGTPHRVAGVTRVLLTREFRKLENHFKALIEMDLFVDWLIKRVS